MSLFDVIILSLVEGITEFLPISSTGHLILTSHVLSIPDSSFLNTFEIAIQLGAILSVVFLYWQKVLEKPNLFMKILVGFIPTGIIGFTLYPLIKSFLGNELITVIALFLGGIALIALEKYFEAKKDTIELEKLSYMKALYIGLVQCVALIPGVSRAAASIFGGMSVRLSRKSAVEFSFLLAVPTMMAATGYDLTKTAPTFTSEQILYLILGIFFSFLVALAALKWLLKYVATHNFIAFGVYRIVFSILYFLIFLR